MATLLSVSKCHRTCIANRLLQPVGPENLPGMLNPDISFVSVPRTSVRTAGPFDKLIEAMMKHFGISVANSRGNTTVPCLTQHLPALLHYFPKAELIETVPNGAVAQAAMRTVSIPGFVYDVKFSLACLVTSALRVLPCWSADAAPKLTCLLKEISPPNLWIVGEVAAVTGNQQDMAEARYMTCILRENLESRAKQNNEALILSSALMEKPMGGSRTYAEVLFDLHTTADKVRWFKRFVAHESCWLARQELIGGEQLCPTSFVSCLGSSCATPSWIRVSWPKLHCPNLQKDKGHQRVCYTRLVGRQTSRSESRGPRIRCDGF